MGALIGLGVGLGLFLMIAPRSDGLTRRRSRSWQRKHDLVVNADLATLDSRRVDAVGILVGVVVFLVVMIATATVPLALAVGAFASRSPWALLAARARRRADQNRLAWPEAVDHLASAVRAGLPLPEAVCALAARGPEALRGQFAEFAAAYRSSGSFPDSLDRLEATLADPVADRVIESLRIAREVGGSDLGSLLRTVSAFLREDGRVRAEIQSRQSATVNAARLACAAPWVVLLLLGTQSSTVQAYNSLTGVIVLGVGAGICALAYRVMLSLGRIPAEARVLR